MAYRNSGSQDDGHAMALAETGRAMTKLKRSVLGVISCLLLAAGFAHAADRLDLLNNEFRYTAETAGGNGGHALSNVPCVFDPDPPAGY